MDVYNVSSLEGGVVLYPRAASLFAAVCAILFIVIGVIGNLMTVVALLSSAKLRAHPTTMFVLSLCVSDLMFCSVNLPLTASRFIYQRWTLGHGLCQLFPFIFYGNEAVSLLSMVAITLNRYILISYYDVYARLYTPSRIWMQLLLIWIVAFSLLLPPALGIWGQLGLDEHTFSCTILPKDDSSPKKFLFVVGFALPCVVIIASYSAIYWRVRKAKRKLESRSKGPAACLREREEDARLTRLMLSIFLCFLICFLPLMLTNVADEGVSAPWLHVVASVLAWASSVLNPLIYAATNRQYRAAYRALYTKVFCVSRQPLYTGPVSRTAPPSHHPSSHNATH